MKKVIFFCFFLMLCSLVFSQEFNVLWLNNMSNYLGKRVRDIPDSYKQEIFNKSYYSRELPHEIYEGFSVSNTNFINGIIWVKKSNSRSFLYSEFDKLINILKNYLGDPLIGDPLIEKDDNVWWNWQSKPLVVSIQEGQVGVMVCTLDFVGSTQDEWDRIVKENSRK